MPAAVPCRVAGVRMLRNLPLETSFPLAVQRVIERENLVPAGTSLLVSVSGGADSVALLRVLLALNARWRWRLQAVHFNHGLRAEADAEEAFVRSLAAEHSVPLHVRRLAPTWADETATSSDESDVSGGGSGGGRSIQESTRNWRRAESLSILDALDDGSDASADAVERAAGGAPSRGVVALGHHADDQVETVLLKALRGAHLSNLYGMRWQHGRFVRPLLGHRKGELVSYLNAIGQAWMEDASNQVPKYKRNKVRLQLVPLLEDLAGGASGLLARVQALEHQSGQLRDWLDQARAAHLESEPAWQRQPRALSVTRLRAQVPLLQDELVHELTRQARGEGATGEALAPSKSVLSYAALRRVHHQLDRGGSEWTVDLTGACSLRRMGDLLTAVNTAVPVAPPAAAGDAVDDVAAGEASLGGEAEAVGGVAVVLPDSPRRRVELGGGTTLEVAAGAYWRVAAGWAGCTTDDAAGGVLPKEASADGVLRLYNLPAGSSLEVRMARDGDRFHPKWRERPVRLVSYLRGQDVPLEERRTLPLICREGTQEVIAVYPWHVARGFEAPGDGADDADGDALWVAVDDVGA